MAKKKTTPLKIPVHIIRTKEFKSEALIKVVDVLSDFDGPLEFAFKKDESTQILDDYFLPKVPSKKNLFEYCQEYRGVNGIHSSEFVVLLTSLPNSKNWFSHFDKARNIFVQGSDWKKYTKADQKYPISYSVIENILQSLMDLELSDTHTPSIGCMNDMCKKKPEILFKLRTADICEDCLKKMDKKKVDARIVNHGLQIMEGLRTQFLFRKEYNRSIVPCSIEVTKYGKFIIPQIGNLTLELDPIFKTIYLLFLQNPKGLKSEKLNEYENKLLTIYRKLSKSHEDEFELRLKKEIPKNDKTIKKLVSVKSSSFKTHKSKLNGEILNQLGKILLEYYGVLGNKKDGFKINLDPKNVKLEF